ncbi:glucose dehydrogenase-like protein [Euroglyphus maynei]|uniref:Glucose dehydrogenase-like protein n=1 Tax=Euroglyphus maynei TaxID=6958 RepID=A0A1Y3BLW9_EURMA|nr:glucose dehydrogenase-like protein [Euroglyphus maynei]
MELEALSVRQPVLPSLPSLTVQLLTVSVILLQRTIRHNSINTKRQIADQYDFLVVGSGTAGAIIAARLTENPDITVLVLEAGQQQTVTTDTPSWARQEVRTEVDWGYETTSQLPYSGRAFDGHVGLPRGLVVGGSHNLNYLVYSRGNPKDFDSWVEEFGTTGWSYQEVLPYFLRSENNTDPKINAINPAYHSTNGPVPVMTPKNPDPIISIFKEELMKRGIPEVDQNGPTQLGINYFQQTIYENATRATTASVFLEANDKKPNLQILTRAFVTRILFSETRDSDDRITAIGLEFEHNNQTRRVYAKREVILSAGSINTPQLLMLSGVGPAEHLSEFGIETLVNLPVGYNLKDHIFVQLDYEIFNESLITSGIDWTLENMYYNFVDFVGPLSQFPIVYMYFNSRMNNETDWPDLQIDFTVSPLVNDLEQIASRYGSVYRDQWRDYYRPHVGQRNRLGILCFHYRPHSTGRLYLNSSNPHDFPLMDTRYLTDQYDVDSMIEVISTALELASMPPFDQYVRLYRQPIPGCQLCPNGPIWKCRSYLECYARTVTTTVGHQVGTCKMGNTNDSVVDPRLRVRGVNRLRVIDGSIFPHITNGNTNAPIMMFAEYGSDMIRQDNGI